MFSIASAPSTTCGLSTRPNCRASVCWKQPIKKLHTFNLLSLILDLGSPELLDSGGQTIGGGVEVNETEDGQKRHNQIEDLEGLADMLRSRMYIIRTGPV